MTNKESQASTHIKVTVECDPAAIASLLAEIERASGGEFSQLQRQDFALAARKTLQAQIDAWQAGTPVDPMALADLIGRRDAAEKAIWNAEYEMLRSLLLSHEAVSTLRPLIEAAFAAGIRAGATDSFEHFLIVTLAGPDGMRPDSRRLEEAEEKIAASLEIPA